MENFPSNISVSQSARHMDKSTYLLEEYKALRSEIAFHANHSRVVESSIALGSAAIYAWAASKATQDLKVFIWWVPVILSFLGAIREYGNEVRTRQIAEYMKKIESHFLVTGKPEGWEHFLDHKRDQKGNQILDFSHYVYWLVMLTSTISLAIYKSLG